MSVYNQLLGSAALDKIQQPRDDCLKPSRACIARSTHSRSLQLLPRKCHYDGRPGELLGHKVQLIIHNSEQCCLGVENTEARTRQVDYECIRAMILL